MKTVTVYSMTTEIGSYAFGYIDSGKIEDLVFYGYSGSTAEIYAENKGFTFKVLGEGTHTHSYTSEVTRAASCTEEGVMTYTCSCGDSYTESISITSHSYGNGVVTKQPTCVEKGKKTFTCSVCGTIYTEEIPAKLGQSFTVKASGLAADRLTKKENRVFPQSCGDTRFFLIMPGRHTG